MLNYFELSLNISPFQPFNEIAVAWLADLGFESFMEEESVLKAYIQEPLFNQEALQESLLQMRQHVSVEDRLILIPGQNWNAQWESSFTPVVLDHLTILAPFHSAEWRKGMYIEIEPKMSFGTGHHATTALMCEAMHALDFNGISVLDMGTGTGVLAIYAEKLGATEILGVDIESWAIENARENAARNDCKRISLILGDIDQVTQRPFEIILANINKNILTMQMEAYQSLLNNSGILLLSGFFTNDDSELIQTAANYNLTLQKRYEKDSWSCLQFIKN